MMIYCAENLVNGKKYVGFTARTLDERFCEHLSDAVTKKSKWPLHRAIRKYGKDNFKTYILYEGEDALEKEDGFIQLMGDYNVISGGGALPNNKGRKHTKETRLNMSKAKKGKKPVCNKGFVLEETKIKISKTLKEKKIKPPSRLGIRMGEKEKLKHKEAFEKYLSTRTKQQLSENTKKGWETRRKNQQLMGGN